MRALGHAIWRPRSVALVGASSDPAKNSGRPLHHLRSAGFAGRVYPINSRRAEVQGERAYPSVAALPEVPDHAFVLAPTEDALDAVAMCASAGVPVVTVLADGIVGHEQRTARLRDALAGTATRLLGPGSLGVVEVRSGLVLTANAAFAETDVPAGGLLVASQSGSAIGAVLSRGKVAGVGFAGLVATGNELDLSLGELCLSTVDDPEVRSYALFLESIAHADRLREFAVAAAERGKPVVAYKLGRSRAAAELAVSHTGALAGDDAVADALFAELGIARVRTFEALWEGQQLAGCLPFGVHPRVGVVTTTGGGGAMAVDALATAGVDVRGPSAATIARLAERGIAAGAGVLVDLTLAGTRYEVMHAALDVMLAAPEFDLVVAVPGSSARFRPDLAVQPILDCAQGSPIPVACFVVPEAPDALQRLRAAGVAAFRTPESLADAVVACARREQARESCAIRSPVGGPVRVLDEAASYERLAAIGVACAAHVVADVQAMPPALTLCPPLAVKALAADLPHKSDVGGVRLGITGPDELRAAAEGIAAATAGHGIPIGRVLVQEMISGLGEAMVGVRRDPDVGVVTVVAAGGTLAELYADRAVRLGRLDHAAARSMIDEVRALSVLRGYRGGPVGDLTALADAVVAVSHLLADDPAVAELEINPLIVLTDGVVAVDAVVRMYSGEPG